MKDDLQERVEKYRAMELPGQPRMVHMGTTYLINDLWREVESLRREVAHQRDLVEGYKNIAKSA